MSRLDVAPDELGWRQRGACRTYDAELWFPDEVRGITAKLMEKRAKAICSDCPVKAECLGWATEKDVRHGVWGGLSAQERGHL